MYGKKHFRSTSTVWIRKCHYATPKSRSSRFFFFFQAEDGIRDLTVTGVQTCALPISDVAQEHVRPPDVARDVLPPAGDRQPTPSAVSGTRGRDHHHVAPVGQEMRARRHTVRRAEAPDDRRGELAAVRDRQSVVLGNSV